MIGTNCPVCSKQIMVGQTIVGMPVIRITALNESKMAGTEILIHVSCFLKQMRDKTLELEIVKG